MSRPQRPKVITGNWKMHMTLDDATSFVHQLIPATRDCTTQIFLAVPFTMIQTLAKEAEGSHVVIGAQNMNDASQGAFTGEIAGSMLVEVGAKFVLLGHSERRHLFKEKNEFINRKVKRAIEVGLRPVLCIGETKEEHQAGRTREILRQQLVGGLLGISAEALENLIVAYEPVWAVGTGEPATPEIAQQEHRFCREILSEILAPELAEKIVIQYGGSVTPANAKQLLSQPDIDGLLIGGASLSLASFTQIVNDSESVLHSKVESL